MKETQKQLKARLDKDIEVSKFTFTFVNKHNELLKKYSTNKTPIKWLSFKVFLKNKLAVFSLVMLLLTIILGLIIPLTTQSSTHLDPYNKHAAPFTSKHWLGTDLAGRDIWARLWHGLRFSLGLAAIATMIDIIFGILIGLLWVILASLINTLNF